MRAVRFSGQGRPLSVEEVARPQPGPGQVLVQVAAAGVCGTELHFLDGLLTPAHVPITLGHEVAGTLVELGEGVDDVAVGDRVAVHYFHSCGSCARSHVVTRPLEDAADVLDDLRAGRVVGRAVLVP